LTGARAPVPRPVTAADPVDADDVGLPLEFRGRASVGSGDQRPVQAASGESRQGTRIRTVSGSERIMDVAAREEQVRTFVEEVWNRRHYEAASDLIGESYENPFGTGPSAKVEPIRLYHQAFPDVHLDIEELIVADDTVTLRMTFRGTDTGGYLGRPPTGRKVEEWVVDIMHFEGDRVVSEWIGADKLGLFIQLGVVDDPWPK
jgi:predicted ester cyclase